MSTVSSPDETRSVGDPGDEIARRYRYQWIYAAIICCLLLDEAEKTNEVFCEHHEDVLVKRSDGQFDGLQIKTRDISQPPWKSDDEAVVKSLVRFCKLEAQFPETFRGFRFLTNHALYVCGNGKDIRYVLAQIRAADGTSCFPVAVKRFVSVVAKAANCDQATAQRALRKTDADDSLPKLADVHMRLIDALTVTWQRAMELTFPAVQRAAIHLADECGRASSLAHEDVLPAYVPVSVDPCGTELRARLEGKRFDRDRLLRVLEVGVNIVAPLSGDPRSLVRPGGGSGDLLEKKLDAGGFSAISRNAAVDLRDKADYLGLVWTQKYGYEEGLQRYSHIRSIVLSDAARAYELVKSKQDPFGLAMLDDLRERLRERRATGTQLYECSNEHLEGVAYSLTSECKVQWSKDRPWEDD